MASRSSQSEVMPIFVRRKTILYFLQHLRRSHKRSFEMNAVPLRLCLFICICLFLGVCEFLFLYLLYLHFATAVKLRCLLRKRFSACSAAEALSLNLPEYLSPHKPNPLLAPHCTSRAAKRSLRCPLPSQNNEILKHRNTKNYSYIK